LYRYRRGKAQGIFEKWLLKPDAMARALVGLDQIRLKLHRMIANLFADWQNCSHNRAFGS
jgi:hypothetical protein